MDLENISYHLQMVQNLAALYQAVWVCGCVYLTESKKLGRWCLGSLGCRHDRPQKLPLPQTDYHDEIGCCRSNGRSTRRGHNNFGALGPADWF